MSRCYVKQRLVSSNNNTMYVLLRLVKIRIEHLIMTVNTVTVRVNSPTFDIQAVPKFFFYRLVLASCHEQLIIHLFSQCVSSISVVIREMGLSTLSTKCQIRHFKNGERTCKVEIDICPVQTSYRSSQHTSHSFLRQKEQQIMNFIEEILGESTVGDPFQFLDSPPPHHSVTTKQEIQEDEIIYMPFKQVREQNSCTVKLEPVYDHINQPSFVISGPPPPRSYAPPILPAHSIPSLRPHPYGHSAKLRRLLRPPEPVCRQPTPSPPTPTPPPRYFKLECLSTIWHVALETTQFASLRILTQYWRTFAKESHHWIKVTSRPMTW